MTLTLTDDTSPVTLNTNTAALSPKTNSYYFAGFSKDNIESCEMNGITVQQDTATAAPTTVAPVAVLCEEDPASYNTIQTDNTKFNFSLLVVTGLRVLFTKTLAFNMILTIKALIF
ncbi:uncharacterized protein trdc isoform 1-T2 [Polymixia lowei]